MRFLLGILCVLACTMHATAPAFAQTPANLWSVLVNLSGSGAASQPVAFAAPDGTLQAFWWDRFDGLTTVVGSGETWSAPLQAQIYISETAWRSGGQPPLGGDAYAGGER